MRPSRFHFAVGKHEDAVRHADAGKTVRDEDRGLTFAQLLEAAEHLVFGTRVQCRRRLVEDKHVGFAPPESSTPFLKRLPIICS